MARGTPDSIRLHPNAPEPVREAGPVGLSPEEMVSILASLPGTVLVEDLAKAVDNGKGKALIQTMNGETLTATKDGGKVVLTDSSGGKATIVDGDQKRSNGVVQYVDAILTPSAQAAQREFRERRAAHAAPAQERSWSLPRRARRPELAPRSE